METEHQAEHWNAPAHGYLIAWAVRASADIARDGGLTCEHRGGAASVPERMRQWIAVNGGLSPRPSASSQAQPAPAAT